MARKSSNTKYPSPTDLGYEFIRKFSPRHPVSPCQDTLYMLLRLRLENIDCCNTRLVPLSGFLIREFERYRVTLTVQWHRESRGEIQRLHVFTFSPQIMWVVYERPTTIRPPNDGELSVWSVEDACTIQDLGEVEKLKCQASHQPFMCNMAGHMTCSTVGSCQDSAQCYNPTATNQQEWHPVFLITK